MPRAQRSTPAGLAYHVLNRTAGRAAVFSAPKDAARFVAVLAMALERMPAAGLLAWCLMPNHWHLVFYPTEDDVLQPLLQWLTLTHVQRHRAASGSIGDGPLYRGRYRSFPIATDEHLLTVLRYVERNPVRSGLVRRARDWPWSSAARPPAVADGSWPTLAPWPIERPRDWATLVDRPMTAAEEADQRVRLQAALARGRPFGPADWARATADRLDLAATLRPRGRPRR